MLYTLSRFLIRLFFKVCIGFKVKGAEHVPEQGGFILAPNHASYMDPPVVGSACPRKVYFMAKSDLFDVPLLGRWMSGVGVISLNLDSPGRSSLKKAVEYLKNGNCVCIFPEGMRVPPGVVKGAEQGVGYLVKMAGVPVVPAAILGTQPCFRKIFGFITWFSPLEVRFGEPISFDFDGGKISAAEKHKILQDVGDKILARINELKSGGS